MAESSVYNLQPMTNFNNDYSYVNGGYTYYYNFCEQVNHVCKKGDETFATR